MAVRSCKSCVYRGTYDEFTGIGASSIEGLKNIELSENEHIEYFESIDFGWMFGVFKNAEDGHCTCNNSYSEYYKDGILDSNCCELYKRVEKEVKPKHEKTKEEIIQEYECDGQLELNI